MKRHNINIVVTVRAPTKKAAKIKLTYLMNRATLTEPEFPEWGFHAEYKLAGEKVKK